MVRFVGVQLTSPGIQQPISVTSTAQVLQIAMEQILTQLLVIVIRDFTGMQPQPNAG